MFCSFISRHELASKSKFNLYTLKVDWEDGQFFWDEEYINTKELVKEFTDKYGKPIDKYSRKKKLNIPVQVLWGKNGVIGKQFKPIKIWQKYSNKKVVGVAVKSGHFIPEQNPKETINN